MVDESDRCFTTIDGDAAHHMRSLLPVVDILQRITIYDGEILHIESVDVIDLLDHVVVCFGYGMCFGEIEAILKRLVDIGSDGPFIGSE